MMSGVKSPARMFHVAFKRKVLELSVPCCVVLGPGGVSPEAIVAT